MNWQRMKEPLRVKYTRKAKEGQVKLIRIMKNVEKRTMAGSIKGQMGREKPQNKTGNI